MRLLPKLWLSLILLLAAAIPVAAQEPITVINEEASYEFRDSLDFTIEAESDAEIVEADLVYQVVGRLASNRNNAEFEPGTSITAQFSLDQTDPATYLPTGTELEYWWELTDVNGNEIETERQPLLYIDDRHDWQTLENDRLTLYWYAGGDDFGQALFDRANEGLDTLEEDIGVAVENQIKVFIYDGQADMLDALSTSAQEWTGGVAYTRYGVVVLGVQPSSLDWGLGAMTHEMTHLVIHQATENPYGDLPRWLDEGIAVYNEGLDTYRIAYDRARETDRLKTLQTLSSPFPADPAEAYIAYAQSGVVVDFIVEEYGTEKMAELLDVFSEGALYDEALEQVLGVNTDGLDNAFREANNLPLVEREGDVAAQPPASEERVVIPDEEASLEEAVPDELTEASEGSQPEEAEEAAAEPVQVEAGAGGSAPSEETAQESAPLGLSCLAGMIVLALFGGLMFWRRLG